MVAGSNEWWDALADIVYEAHGASGPDVARVSDRAVRRLGMSAELYLADRGQEVLARIATGERPALAIGGTLPGLAFQLEQPVHRFVRGEARSCGCRWSTERSDSA